MCQSKEAQEAYENQLPPIDRVFPKSEENPQNEANGEGLELEESPDHLSS